MTWTGPNRNKLNWTSLTQNTDSLIPVSGWDILITNGRQRTPVTKQPSSSINHQKVAGDTQTNPTTPRPGQRPLQLRHTDLLWITRPIFGNIQTVSKTPKLIRRHPDHAGDHSNLQRTDLPWITRPISGHRRKHQPPQTKPNDYNNQPPTTNPNPTMEMKARSQYWRWWTWRRLLPLAWSPRMQVPPTSSKTNGAREKRKR